MAPNLFGTGDWFRGRLGVGVAGGVQESELRQALLAAQGLGSPELTDTSGMTTSLLF